ncbi:MAG: hypothetical protein AVDCRST_MAG25-3433 [uncultured Rubrobacteraceae bacterium]|uniref:Uncharacterized protein n=1 Tax=uncultured Rubrobacteraceae bacterium TaxID=349277 RepID=A0A6J4SD01_9ACTN|nr:MAG: hypothetical protein AVDCRST_MAG25-3433 [uncultured Rubrobacteraceae bacterium]
MAPPRAIPAEYRAGLAPSIDAKPCVEPPSDPRHTRHGAGSDQPRTGRSRLGPEREGAEP